MNRIGLVIAVKDEAAGILAEPDYRWEKKDNMVYVSKKYPLSLSICGIGKVFAVHGLSKILKNSDLVISMGTSGGLSDEKIGDIYLIDEFVEHDMDVTGLGVPHGVTPFSWMKSPVISSCSKEAFDFTGNVINKSGFNFTRGRTISGDTFLCDPEITNKKRDTFKAQLCDMESAALAKICASEEGVNMLAIRYITDNANHESAGNWQENVKKSASIFNKILLNYFD